MSLQIELNKIVNLADREISTLRRYAQSGRDECDDFNEGYEYGITDALERYEDTIENIVAILKDIEIQEVLEKSTPPTEGQLKLEL